MGITKRIFYQLIRGDNNTSRTCKAVYNHIVGNVKNLREHPRRPRPASLKTTFKGNEFNFLLLAVFPYFFDRGLDIDLDFVDDERWL